MKTDDKNRELNSDDNSFFDKQLAELKKRDVGQDMSDMDDDMDDVFGAF